MTSVTKSRIPDLYTFVTVETYGFVGKNTLNVLNIFICSLTRDGNSHRKHIYDSR
jgi:hypothetical protein